MNHGLNCTHPDCAVEESLMEQGKKRTVPTWPRESLWERLQRCRAMLNMHGYLPPAVNGRISKRIDKDHLVAPSEDKRSQATGAPSSEERDR